MNAPVKRSEDIVRKLVGSEVGRKYSLASTLEDIDEFPIKEFGSLQNLLSSGEAVIRMSPGSIDATTFNILSTPLESKLLSLYAAITYIGPLLGIALAFIYSWYWALLVIVAPLVGMQLNKNLYFRIIFNRAFNSETLFSYLFTAGKVTIELPGHGILYRNPAQ